MADDWNQAKSSNRWPGRQPAWTLNLIMLSAVIIALSFWAQYRWWWDPLAQWYFPKYLSASLKASIGMKSANYRVLYVVNPRTHKQALAFPGTVVLAENQPPGYENPFVASSAAAAAGYSEVVLSAPESVDLKKYTAILDHEIYKDATWGDWLRVPIGGGLGFLLLGLFVAILKDKERARIRREGRRLRGPEMVSAATFNRRNRSDGIGFITEEPGTFAEWLLRREGDKVRIPHRKESSHFLLLGDTGAGKSSIIRQLLIEIARRGETAIVYDPGPEYINQFYSPERGDVILNPLDARMPYWSPADEVIHEAEAATLAASLFPEQFGSNPFFITAPRRIFAHLLTLEPRPTPTALVKWLSDDQELDRKLKGSDLAGLMYQSAGGQRGGILGELNIVANSLKLLPTREETKASWTAAEWSKQRRGWIFITGVPNFRERLRPLISMWLDMLILRLMNEGQPGPRPVWFVMDEVTSLHKLPQLHTAITENRKSGNPVVLGFQGRSQLESLYGRQAEAMLSQPMTRLYMFTKEPNAAKWISESIGKQDIQRLRQNRMEGGQRGHSRSEETTPDEHVLATPDEISGLSERRAYLKYENLVVRLSFPYIDLPSLHEKFMARPIRAEQLKEKLLTAGAQAASAPAAQEQKPKQPDQDQEQDQEGWFHPK